MSATPSALPANIDSIADWKWDDHYDFPRNLVGYGEKGHNPKWPNNAKIAVSFVINYEEVGSSMQRTGNSRLITCPGRREHCDEW